MKTILILLIVSSSFYCGKIVEIEYIPTKANEIPLPILYPDVGSILKVLEHPLYRGYEEVEELLKIYYMAQAQKHQFDLSGGIKKYPLIVIEGLAGTGKTTTATGLAKKINATKIHSPLPIFKKLHFGLAKNLVICNAYHQLAHYITVFYIYPLLQEGPVILDRYWHSSATYSIARTALYTFAKKLPPKEDKIYVWPEDLLKPDTVMFLTIDEALRTKRIRGRVDKLEKNERILEQNPIYRKNTLLAYENMNNPSLIFINANPSKEEVLKEVYSKVKYLLKNNRV